MAWVYFSIYNLDGRSVQIYRIMSKVLSLRVGKSTICSRRLSAIMLRDVLLSTLEFWAIDMVRYLRIIYVRLDKDS